MTGVLHRHSEHPLVPGTRDALLYGPVTGNVQPIPHLQMYDISEMEMSFWWNFRHWLTYGAVSDENFFKMIIYPFQLETLYI